MFKDDFFEKWLDKKAESIVEKLAADKTPTTEEMIILVLNAQSNHFYHLDVELKSDMRTLREDMTSDTRALREDLSRDMKDLREDMAARFEQVDRRFDRVYSFMKWELGLLAAAIGGLYIKLFIG